MPVVRYLVDDVDEALPFYELLGFVLADRWGPPFAIVESCWEKVAMDRR